MIAGALGSRHVRDYAVEAETRACIHFVGGDIKGRGMKGTAVPIGLGQANSRSFGEVFEKR